MVKMKYCDEYYSGINKVIDSNPIISTAIKNSSIFITGAGGLICSTLCDLLLYMNKQFHLNNALYFGARNKKKILERFSEFNEGTDYYYINYDASQKLDISINFNYIIHGAGNAVPVLFDKKPVETIIDAINGLNEILLFASKNQNCRVIYISSSEVYGKKGDQLAYKEEDYSFVDILNPRACYPSSKRVCETLCSSYFKEYNVDSVIVRPGHIYGPQFTEHDNRAATVFLKDVLKGDIIMKSKGSQLRSFCNSLDCASAILTVLIKGNTNCAYNISNPKSIATIFEYAECLAKIAGRKIQFENPSDSELKSYNLMDISSLDSTKIENLGWQGVFNLEEGIIHSFKVLNQ